jgi:hypothetical protein
VSKKFTSSLKNQSTGSTVPYIVGDGEARALWSSRDPAKFREDTKILEHVKSTGVCVPEEGVELPASVLHRDFRLAATSEIDLSHGVLQMLAIFVPFRESTHYSKRKLERFDIDEPFCRIRGSCAAS